jgi:hypothetical protein
LTHTAYSGAAFLFLEIANTATKNLVKKLQKKYNKEDSF